MTARTRRSRRREVEEKIGWRSRQIEFVMSVQPPVGNADYPQDLYPARTSEAKATSHSPGDVNTP
jgi:hypothetical protein